MTILGWQLNTWSDAAFRFVLGYQTVNFRILVVPFNKALFFVANSGYFTVFTPHIYFIILINMIAGNLVEIRLPKIQSRKCLRKFNFNEIRESYQPATCLNPRNLFLPRCLKCSLPLAYRIFDLLLVVVFFHYVLYCCHFNLTLYRMSEYPRFMLVNRNTLGP